MIRRGPAGRPLVSFPSENSSKDIIFPWAHRSVSDSCLQGDGLNEKFLPFGIFKAWLSEGSNVKNL